MPLVNQSSWRLILLACVFVIASLQECAHADAFSVGPSVGLRTQKIPHRSAEQAVLSHDGPTVSLRAGESTEGEKLWTKDFGRVLLAEFLGTGLIVGLGTGAVMSAIFTNSLVGLWQIAVVWVVAVTIAIATTGPISGAHLNPAVSIAFALLRPKSFSWNKVLPYSVAQTLGAAFFSWTNLLLYSGAIKAFEQSSSIARGTQASIASAKAFGEYFA